MAALHPPTRLGPSPRQPTPPSGLMGSAGGPLPYETVWTPASDAEPFRLTFTGTGFEIAAKITSPDVADDLVRAINALKLLLRPTSDFKAPQAGAPSAQVGSHESKEGIPFLITHEQKARLRGAGVSDQAIFEMTPQEAQDRLAALDG